MHVAQGAPHEAPLSCSVGAEVHPVIVAIRDKKDYIRALIYSYYATITGRGVLLS